MKEANRFSVFEDRKIAPSELANLMASVGWGDEADYDRELVELSMASYPFIAHVRDLTGKLVGYVSAFSDGAFSTFIGELAVRPEVQHLGLGTELLDRVERHYPGIPVYAHSFADQEGFFAARGYRVAARPQRVLFKIPA